MKKTELVVALRTVPLLRGLSDRELQSVARYVREDTFRAGDNIVTEGETGGPFYLIIEGTAKAIVGGRSRGTIGPGQAFGEISLIDQGVRSATIRAETDMKTLAVTSWNFLSLLEDNWKLAHKVMVELCRRIRALDKLPAG
jgi:CRP/FNR family cyclic AMP-dependent transcriptional regulator